MGNVVDEYNQKKWSTSIILFLSSLCVFLLIIPTNGVLRFVVFYALFIPVLICSPIRFHTLRSLSNSSLLFCIMAFSLGVWCFCGRWEYVITALFPFSRESSGLFVFLIGIVLAFCGSFFISSLIESFIRPVENQDSASIFFDTKKKHRHDIVICLLMAITVITFCNMVSFLYPTNPWCSPSCYHTVGKALWSGKMPYLDLYEHKGPLIYLLHSIATLFSYRSYIGMYFMLIPFAFYFFYYSRKTLVLFTNRPLEPWFPIVCVGVYALNAYHTGDSAEEISFPFMAYSLFVAFRYLKNGNSFTKNTSIAVGIGMAVIFWTKFNLTFFYVPWLFFLMIDMARRHCFSDFIFLVKYVFCGFLFVTVPIILFYAVMGALPALIEVYFQHNMFNYLLAKPLDASADDNFSYLFRFYLNLKNSLSLNLPLYVMIIVGMFAFWKLGKRYFSFLALLEVAVFILVFIKLVVFSYYPLIFGVFVPLSVLPLTRIKLPVELMRKSLGKITLVALTVMGTVLVLLGSDNLKYLFLQKEEFVQFRFAKSIMKVDHPTLLNYRCLDQGVFAITGLQPINRFFCDNNIDAPGKREEQDSIVSHQGVDFLITDDYSPDIDRYCIIDSMRSPVYDRMFYLYKKVVDNFE